jgi:hypothetical protein
LYLCKVQEREIYFPNSVFDDILLASSDVSLLLETKRFLFSNFDMKDLSEASFIIGIEIHQRNWVLELSQKAYL